MRFLKLGEFFSLSAENCWMKFIAGLTQGVSPERCELRDTRTSQILSVIPQPYDKSSDLWLFYINQGGCRNLLR